MRRSMKSDLRSRVQAHAIRAHLSRWASGSLCATSRVCGRLPVVVAMADVAEIASAIFVSLPMATSCAAVSGRALVMML